MTFVKFILLITSIGNVLSEKCYSCSSAQLHHRWPKNEENEMLYLKEFPYFANESCDLVKNLLPVVSCPNSVCVKVVLNEPPKERAVCLAGSAIVRDCWTRIVREEFWEMHKDKIRLADGRNANLSVGHILTCEGYLCNSSWHPFSFLILFIYLFLIN